MGIARWAASQTINSLFGARYIVPGTGMIPNNYMFRFTPHPGRTNPAAPGSGLPRRCRRSMLLRTWLLRYALRPAWRVAHFPFVMQAISQPDRSRHERAGGRRRHVCGLRVSAWRWKTPCHPKCWRRCVTRVTTWRYVLATSAAVWSAIRFDDDGTMTGAACWRADGNPNRNRRRLCPRRRPVQAGGRTFVATR